MRAAAASCSLFNRSAGLFTARYALQEAQYADESCATAAYSAGSGCMSLRGGYWCLAGLWNHGTPVQYVQRLSLVCITVFDGCVVVGCGLRMGGMYDSGKYVSCSDV